MVEPDDRQPEKPPGGWTEAHRIELLGRHPLACRRYTIPTPMVQYAYQAIRERVYARRTGLVFIGKTRYGKTTCAYAALQYLLQEFPTIHAIFVPARSTQRTNDGHAYRVILKSEHHICAGRTDPDALFDNLVSEIEVALYAKGGDQFVMILDEINLFKQQDIVKLLELGNALQKQNITMTVISFAQPDVEQLITSLQKQNLNQLIARFFRRPKSFDGCTTQKMLEIVLRYLDEKSEWPEGSGWSYTEFFFPMAFRKGFRFYRYSDIIWNELDAVMRGPEGGICMEAVSMTIEWLFLSLHQDDDEVFVLKPSDVQNAIRASDYGWGV
ncbi:ATP-binding protein [Burkholderia sp. MS455]|uniref:ATP-binding protein n=1 Tax=Burkholderia sp. MS455 TaxID=2811788 RepID=UPI00195EF95B|nr:ATP-binding protein [Burkholderia sp. MS455]QRR07709.1 ATP-binding protein [Burkholderia sp. MS455]